MRKPQSPAIYVRISSDPLGLRAGVERQREDCEALRQRLGWGEAAVYEDNDISASKGLRRPAYERLLADCEAGIRDGILVYSTDRLTRRLSELAAFLDWRTAHEIPFATTEGDDTTSANGRMVIQIKGAVAQQEAERLGERIRRSRDQDAARGRPAVTGRRPFGFEPDCLTLIEDEAELIREAARRVLAGESPGVIADDWNRRGVPTVTGAKWQRPTLRNILLSPRTTALRLHRGVVVGEGAWPAILDRETWEAVGAVLARKFARPAGWNTRKHLLAGFAVCGICGVKLAARAYAQGRSPRYVCAKDRGGCGKIARNIPAVDGWVERLVLAYLERFDLEGEALPEPDGLGEAIAEAEAAIARLYAAQEAGEIDDADFFPLLRGRRERLNELREEQASRVREGSLGGIVGPGIRELWAGADLAKRRAILSLVVEAVVVKPTGKGGRRFVPEAVVVVPRGAERELAAVPD